MPLHTVAPAPVTRHDLDAMPGPLARGPAARAAYDRWFAAHVWLLARHRAVQVDTAAAPVTPADTGQAAGRTIRVGMGVWCRVRMVGSRGVTWVRGHVLGRDDLTGRWHICNIDQPRQCWYVAADTVWPRYQGEISPGVQGPATGGTTGSTGGAA